MPCWLVNIYMNSLTIIYVYSILNKQSMCALCIYIVLNLLYAVSVKKRSITYRKLFFLNSEHFYLMECSAHIISISDNFCRHKSFLCIMCVWKIIAIDNKLQLELYNWQYKLYVTVEGDVATTTCDSFIQPLRTYKIHAFICK